jgi:hypothetical protein
MAPITLPQSSVCGNLSNYNRNLFLRTTPSNRYPQQETPVSGCLSLKKRYFYCRY